MSHVTIMAPTTFPTLDAIDRARGSTAPFAADTDAASLEALARALVDEHWSETAWLTGRVSAARFAAVVARLEQTRRRSGPTRADVPIAS